MTVHRPGRPSTDRELMGITYIYMIRGFGVDLGELWGKMRFLVWDTWVFEVSKAFTSIHKFRYTLTILPHLSRKKTLSNHVNFNY